MIDMGPEDRDCLKEIWLAAKTIRQDAVWQLDRLKVLEVNTRSYRQLKLTQHSLQALIDLAEKLAIELTETNRHYDSLIAQIYGPKR